MEKSFKKTVVFNSHRLTQLLKSVALIFCCTPPKIWQNCLHPQTDRDLNFYSHLNLFLHTNCKWDVNDSIMCGHYRWLKAAYLIQIFCLIFWLISNNYIKRHLFSSDNWFVGLSYWLKENYCKKTVAKQPVVRSGSVLIGQVKGEQLRYEHTRILRITCLL